MISTAIHSSLHSSIHIRYRPSLSSHTAHTDTIRLLVRANADAYTPTVMLHPLCANPLATVKNRCAHQQLSAVAANRAAADKALASAVAALDGEIAAAELQAAAVAAVRIRASFPTSTSEVVSASCGSSLMDAVTKARRHAEFDVNTTGNYNIIYSIMHYALLYVHTKVFQKCSIVNLCFSCKVCTLKRILLHCDMHCELGVKHTAALQLE
jgi:hypothetical protein